MPNQPVLAYLTEDEKNLVRYFLGYLINNANAGSIQLGFPRASEPMFLVEQAMNMIPSAMKAIWPLHI